MKPIPLHLIVAHLNRMSLPAQIHKLRELVAAEKPFSVRRNELQSLLTGKLNKQLRRESRAA